MKSQSLKKFNLPDQPGVYFFRKGKEIIYIGKATSLRDRVRSYFAKDLIQTRGPGILDMVTIADRITFETTESVFEALVLEANLIKKYQPKYNVKEKDNKSFAYMIITDEDFPRIGTIRGRTLQVQQQMDAMPCRVKYTFGPFPSHGSLLAGLRILRKIFPFRDLKSNNPTHDRFYKQLQLSPDHTTVGAQKKYQENVQHIVQFFKGNKKGIIRDLKKKMHTYAAKMQFEFAQDAKHKILGLEHLNDITMMRRDFYEDVPMETFRIESYDVAHISGRQTVGVMVVVENGQADKSSYRKFKICRIKDGEVNDIASMQEILERRFTHAEWPAPDLVVVDGGKTHYDHAVKILKKIGQGTIMVASVVKNERHQPKGIIGPNAIIRKHRAMILLANSEAHRFAIGYHSNLRARHFLK